MEVVKVMSSTESSTRDPNLDPNEQSKTTLPFTDAPCPIMFDRFSASSGLICPLSGARCADTRPSEDWLALSSSSRKGKRGERNEVRVLLNTVDHSGLLYRSTGYSGNCGQFHQLDLLAEASQTSTDKRHNLHFPNLAKEKIIIKPDYVSIIGLN